MLFLSGSALGSSADDSGIPLRFACIIGVVTTPGLRSVAPVRSPFLVPRHCAFPTLGRYDPPSAASALLVPRSPSVPPMAGGILPPGLVMRRHPCRRRSAIYPARRLPAEDCDALPVVAPVALLPVGARRLARSSSGAASSRKRRRASCPPKTRGEHQRALWFRRLASAFRWLVVTPSV